MDQLFNVDSNDTKEIPHLRKDDILSQIGQEEIFEHYLGVPVQYRHHFRSPLRQDDNPTCSFTWKGGKLLFRDWSESRAKDCFNVVEEIHHTDFYSALEIIASDFGLADVDPTKREAKRKTLSVENHRREQNNEKSIIRVKRQRLTADNIAYLKSYHLTHRITKYYNVYSIKHFWLNGNLFYSYTDDKPALAYYFGQDSRGREKWKIYFYRSRDSWRFIGNTNRINGWIQIPENGELLVITKSLKDVMCLARFGIPAIAMQAETQIPYDYIVDELKDRFTHIYSLLDYDTTGKHAAWKMKKLYDIPALFFDDSFEVKDFSDYLKKHDKDQTLELVTDTLQKLPVNESNLNIGIK